MWQYDFTEQLTWSQTLMRGSVEPTLKASIPDVIGIKRGSKEEDKSGIDFIVTIQGGTEILIDHKARAKGCSRYWIGTTPVPDIAIETWSVIPSPSNPEGKIGWTLDKTKRCHYTLHTFDPSDYEYAFLFPFQLLRAAAHRNTIRSGHKIVWAGYQPVRQSSGSWQSECCFVPVPVIIESIKTEMAINQTNALKQQPHQYSLFNDDGARERVAK